MEEFPSYPTQICSTCKELVDATFALKIMYEKTSQTLGVILKPLEQDVQIKLECEDDDFFCDSPQIMYNDNSEEVQPEEEIILKIEEPEIQNTNEEVPTEEWDKVLTKTQRFAISRRQKRLIEKEKDQILSEKVDKHIEKSLEKVKFKFDKPTTALHLCPVCWKEIPEALQFRAHIKTHKALKKYFKGELQ